MDTRTYTIEPNGPFSLEEAANFGFGQRHDDAFDGTMRLAFCVDGFEAQAGVAVTQDHDGMVQATIAATARDTDPAAVVAQVARVLSLDHDATGFVGFGRSPPGAGPPPGRRPGPAAAVVLLAV